MPHSIRKSSNLQREGPIIEVVIIPPSPVAKLLQSQNLPIPSQKAIALIDTGATTTCIDNSIAKALSLVSHNTVKVMTAGGEDNQCVYDVGLVLPHSAGNAFSLQVLEAKLENQPYRVLIGRDLLRHCTLIYNGWDNSYTLHL